MRSTDRQAFLIDFNSPSPELPSLFAGPSPEVLEVALPSFEYENLGKMELSSEWSVLRALSVARRSLLASSAGLSRLADENLEEDRSSPYASFSDENLEEDRSFPYAGFPDENLEEDRSFPYAGFPDENLEDRSSPYAGFPDENLEEDRSFPYAGFPDENLEDRSSPYPDFADENLEERSFPYAGPADENFEERSSPYVGLCGLSDRSLDFASLLEDDFGANDDGWPLWEYLVLPGPVADQPSRFGGSLSAWPPKLESRWTST
jgi:hypothetical protein